MRTLMGLVMALAVAATTLPGQDVTQLYSRPAVPDREALERLNLKMDWRVYVPMEGRRDGLASVQLLGDQLFVQTRSGMVQALNAGDGATLWRTRVGVPYRVTHSVGVNKDSLFTVRGTRLYALERKTGRVQWEYEMPNAASAAPAADDEHLYLCLGGGRFYVYDLPPDGGPRPLVPGMKKPDVQPLKEATPYGVSGAATTAVGPLSSASRSGLGASAGPQPDYYWDFHTGTRLEQTPFLTEDLAVLTGADGKFFVVAKTRRQVAFEFQTDAAISAPVGHHSALQENGQILDMAYVASQDFNVYALDVLRGKIQWRFTGGAPILKKPDVTDEDLYVAPERAGLFRVNRANGAIIWRNREAVRYLSSNKKYVYATDRSGRLLVLDRGRGLQRAAYDTRDFVVPISNDWTDRFFLASHDGLIVCLHDREYVTPLVTKTIPEKKKPEEVKPEEKPKEKEKEKEKE